MRSMNFSIAAMRSAAGMVGQSAPSKVIRLAGGGQGLQSLLLLQIRSRAQVNVAAQRHRHMVRMGLVDVGHVATPLMELAVHEVLRVVQRLGDGVLGRIEQGILYRNGVGHARSNTEAPNWFMLNTNRGTNRISCPTTPPFTESAPNRFDSAKAFRTLRCGAIRKRSCSSTG